MREVFLTIVRMGLVSGYAVLVVLLVRHLLRRFPKHYSYLLWSVVFLRLVCPIGIEGSFSLVPDILFVDAGAESGEPIIFPASQPSGEKEGNTYSNGDTDGLGYVGNMDADHTANSGKMEMEELEKLGNYAPDNLPHHRIPENETTKGTQEIFSAARQNFSVIFVSVLSFLWIGGMLLFWGIWAQSIHRFRKRLVGATRVEKGVYESDSVTASFVDGIFHPVIYLAPGLSGTEREYVLCHERVHIARRDPQIKAAALFLVSIYWFHPLIWLAFKKMCEDMEMSCDERVVELLGAEIKKEYSRTLLKMAQGADETGLLAAFGGNEVKSRVKNVLSYRKPKSWLAILLLVAVAAVGIGLSLDPGRKNMAAEKNMQGQSDPDDANIPDTGDESNKGNSGSEDVTNNKDYFSILASYHTALQEELRPGELVEKGFSSLAAYCYGEDTLEKIGYIFLDLDGDKTDELLIGAVGGDDFIRRQIFELYCLKNGVPTQVFAGRERDRYYLCQDEGNYVIVNEGSSSASDGEWSCNVIREGKLIPTKTIIYKSSETMVYDGSVDESDMSEENMGRPATQKDEEMIRTYNECRITPEYIPFSDFDDSKFDFSEMGEDEDSGEAEDGRMGKKISGKYLKNQIDLIFSQREIWEQTDEFIAEETQYTVVDLNGNGRLELVAASCQGTGHYTYTDIYEVSEDGDSLVHYMHTVPEGDSQADIIWGVAPVYYSQEEGGYRYLFDDLIRDGAAYYYESRKILELKENQILETTLAHRITEYIDSVPIVTYGSGINGMRVTNEQEYEDAPDKIFEGWRKGMAYFLWFTAPGQGEDDGLWKERLEVSYRSFSIVFEASAD